MYRGRKAKHVASATCRSHANIPSQKLPLQSLHTSRKDSTQRHERAFAPLLRDFPKAEAYQRGIRVAHVAGEQYLQLHR
jgi:hypothetical protein